MPKYTCKVLAVNWNSHDIRYIHGDMQSQMRHQYIHIANKGFMCYLPVPNRLCMYKAFAFKKLDNGMSQLSNALLRCTGQTNWRPTG